MADSPKNKRKSAAPSHSTKTLAKQLACRPPAYDQVREGYRRRRIENESAVRTTDELPPHEQALLLEKRLVAELRIPDRNIRKTETVHVEGVVESIRKHGVVRPIIITPEGEVIDGVIIVLALIILNVEMAYCVVLPGVTRTDRRVLRAKLNRLQEKGAWDLPVLATEIIELGELQISPVDLGFDRETADLVVALAKNLGAAEPAAAFQLAHGQPITERGDRFLLGVHILFCGDAKELSSYVIALGKLLFRILLSDPPFDRTANSIGGRGKIKHGPFVEASGELGFEGYVQFSIAYLTALKGFALPGALAYLFIDWQNQLQLMLAAREAGLIQKQLAIWDKGRGGQGGLYRCAHELIPIWSFDEKPYVSNVQLGRYGRDRSNIFRYPGATTPGSSAWAQLAVAPTPKSVECLADILLDVTHRDDVVLDPFVGSGTIFIAAERTGRVAVGLELDPKFCDAAIRRWEIETGREARLEATGETFAELTRRRTAEREAHQAAATSPHLATDG